MAWEAANAEPYPVDVVDPETGNTEKVMLRRMNAGQYADVQDAMFDEEKGEGFTRLVIVKHSIVSWTFPFAFSPDKVDGLDPAIVLQIYAQIRKDDLNPFRQVVLLAASKKPEPEATTEPASPVPAASADDVDE